MRAPVVLMRVPVVLMRVPVVLLVLAMTSLTVASQDEANTRMKRQGLCQSEIADILGTLDAVDGRLSLAEAQVASIKALEIRLAVAESQVASIKALEDRVIALEQNNPATNRKKLQDLQAKYDAVVTEKDLVEKQLTDLQTKYNGVVNAKNWMEKHLTVDVTLDPNTAHPKLTVSEDGKQVRRGDTKRDVPDNAERFDWYACVVGKKTINSGYFAVPVENNTHYTLGMVRENIPRKGGRFSYSPRDGVWIIQLYNGVYKALADPLVVLSLPEKPQKVGVFVNSEKGEITFYNPEQGTVIYSFTAQRFTEKLLPFFCPGTDSVPLVITPGYI